MMLSSSFYVRSKFYVHTNIEGITCRYPIDVLCFITFRGRAELQLCKLLFFLINKVIISFFHATLALKHHFYISSVFGWSICGFQCITQYLSYRLANSTIQILASCHLYSVLYSYLTFLCLFHYTLCFTSRFVKILISNCIAISQSSNDFLQSIH